MKDTIVKDNAEKLPREVSPCPALPFPEWSDSQINQEHWEKTEKKNDVSKLNAPPETQMASPEATCFTDEQVVHVPSSINVQEWKRLVDIYQNADFVITQGMIDFAGLKDGSRNVMHSEFMRSFISAIGILEHISMTNPWPVESVTPNYFPNTGKEPWKPWHHIYSLCKAGKGTHLPKFNRSGKYIVRLHWMGCWRKIYVDDHLPVDVENNVLLPSFAYRPEQNVETEKMAKPSKAKEDGKDKKDKKAKKGKTDNEAKTHPPKTTMEIWQFILCKALLKIASLSWNDSGELVDFCPINCLTGWACQKLDTLGMSSMDIWRICESFAPKYEWDEGRVKSSAAKKGTSEKRSKNSSKGSKSSKGTKKNGAKLPEEDNVLPYAIVATCFDIRKLTEEETLRDIPATWSCDVLIEQVRDVPLDKPPPKPELARWKRFRWIAWAIRKGIISPDDDISVQCLKLFSSLNKCPEVDRNVPSKPQSAKHSKSDKSKISSKGSKSSSKKSQVKVFPQLDRSVWIDFSKIQYAITVVYVFFKPSKFHTKIKLSDAIQKSEDQNKPAKKDKKPEVQEIYYPSVLGESRNEPMYIFSDSLDHKFVVLNLSQMGNVGRLLRTPEIQAEEAQNFCYVTLEAYDWQTNRCGEVVLFINTRATKTALVYFKPGRFLCKLWVKSDNCFMVMVLSETPVTVGNHRILIAAMTSESLSLVKLSHDVSNNFGKLVQSFGTPSYLEAMRIFYGTYKSSVSLVTKAATHEIYRTFLDVLMKILADNSELRFALKVLFLTTTGEGRSTYDYEGVVDGYEEDPKTIERAAVKIQSVLRCVLVKKMMALHNMSNAKHAKVYENLRKIYGQIFSLQNRDCCVALMRNVFCQLADANYLQECPVFKDLRSVVTVQSFNGSVPSDANTWVVLTRKKFFCTNTKPIKIGVYSYCSLKKYVVRVFDNDTGEEFFRFTNNVAVCAYEKNVKGYTVLCYGWTEEVTTDLSYWTLYVVCQKEAAPQIYIPEQTTYEKSLVECYNPNVDNQICKCVLEVSRSTTITLRLSTSYSTAKIRLYCMNEYGQILNEIVGTGDVVLPLTHLEGTSHESSNLQKVASTQKQHRTSKSTPKSSSRLASSASLVVSAKSFYVEAFVLEDSWPLTRKEWMVVVNERKKYLLHPDESGDFYVTMSNELPAKGKNVRESPYWQLHVVYDVSEALTLARDVRRDAEIKNIKQEWYKKDPNRASKSKEIREEYLRTHRANYTGSGSDLVLLPKLNLATSYLAKPTGSKSSLTMIPLVTRSSKINPRGTSSLKMNPPSQFPSNRADSSRDLKTASSGVSLRSNSAATVTLSGSFGEKLTNDERLIKWNPVIEALAPFDVNRFTENVDNVSIDDRTVVTEEWETLEETNRSKAREKYFEELYEYQDNMDKVLCDQLENFVLLKQWEDENKEKSARTLEAAYKLRDNFIQSLLQAKETSDAQSKSKKKSKTGSKKSSKKSK